MITARHSHTAVVHNSCIWVFGGIDTKGRKNDLWSWDFGMILVSLTSLARFSLLFLSLSLDIQVLEVSFQSKILGTDTEFRTGPIGFFTLLLNKSATSQPD